MSFLMSASYSDCIAEREEGLVNAALVDLGSRASRRVGLILGLVIPDLA